MTEKIDFLPDGVRTARKIRRRVGQAIIGSLGLWGAVMCAAVAFSIQNARVESKIEPLRERVESMRDWQARVGSLADRLRVVTEKHQTMGRLLQKSEWSAVLGVLSSAMNEHTWLTHCTLSREQDSESEDGESMIDVLRISGMAVSNVDLVEFTSQLAQSPYLNQLRLETSRTSSNVNSMGMVEFEMAGTIQSQTYSE